VIIDVDSSSSMTLPVVASSSRSLSMFAKCCLTSSASEQRWFWRLRSISTANRLVFVSCSAQIAFQRLLAVVELIVLIKRVSGIVETMKCLTSASDWVNS
jgi:hypothetical protein